jgi:hypothetical protein
VRVEEMTPQSITQEHDAAVFFVYDWYQHERERGGGQSSLARGYRISEADVDDVLSWLTTTPPVPEDGYTATTRELYALIPRPDRPGEHSSVRLLTKHL